MMSLCYLNNPQNKYFFIHQVVGKLDNLFFSLILSWPKSFLCLESLNTGFLIANKEIISMTHGKGWQTQKLCLITHWEISFSLLSQKVKTIIFLNLRIYCRQQGILYICIYISSVLHGWVFCLLFVCPICSSCPPWKEKSIKYHPGTEITDGCELSCRCWEQSSHPLEEQLGLILLSNFSNSRQTLKTSYITSQVKTLNTTPNTCVYFPPLIPFLSKNKQVLFLSLLNMLNISHCETTEENLQILWQSSRELPKSIDYITVLISNL